MQGFDYTSLKLRRMLIRAPLSWCMLLSLTPTPPPATILKTLIITITSFLVNFISCLYRWFPNVLLPESKHVIKRQLYNGPFTFDRFAVGHAFENQRVNQPYWVIDSFHGACLLFQRARVEVCVWCSCVQNTGKEVILYN